MAESNLDRMRKAAKEKPPVVPPPSVPLKKPKPQPKPKAETPPPAPKKPKGVCPPPAPKFFYTCKHFTTQKDIENRACVNCVKKCRRERRKRMHEKADAKSPVVKRLPEGSVKTLTWSTVDDVLRWRGTLTIPDVPEVFKASGDSERECYYGLHNAYLAYLMRQQKAEPAPEVPADVPVEEPKVDDAPGG